MSDDPLQRGTPAGSLRFFAVLYAPERARPLLHALYAYEAEIDDTVRATHDVSHTRLQWWRGEIDRLLGGQPQHPITRALLPMREHVDLSLLHEVLVAADITLARLALANAAELEAFSYRAAGSLQTLAAAAACLPATLAPAEREFARKLGSAVLQTESLRDIRNMIATGRLPFPVEVLEQAGINPNELRPETMTPALAALLDRTRRGLQARLRGLPALLTPGQRTVQRQGLVLAELNRRLLDRIDHRVELARTRAEVPHWTKLWTAWRTAVRYG